MSFTADFYVSPAKSAIPRVETVQIDSGRLRGRQFLGLAQLENKEFFGEMKTVLLGLVTALMHFFALACSAQVSKLPPRMPENTIISFNENGGMTFAFTKIEITNQKITVEEKKATEKEARQWSTKIEKSEPENLYKIFVESRFDLIKNDERKGIVYDAGSEGISINLGAGAYYGVSYGPNSPLSGGNLKRYKTIADAIKALRAKYESQAQADINFTVLDLGEESFSVFFKNSYPARLSENELTSVKSILRKAVSDYNVKPQRGSAIENLAKYKFQFVALLSPKAEKEVWVNAFCDDFGRDWRTEILMVNDGGSCYFNFYVNLTRQTYDRFDVNGEA